MNFEQKRRQQFLGESHYLDEIPRFEDVIYGSDGLLAGLKAKESQRGLHASLASGVGFELFNKMLLQYSAGEPVDVFRQDLEKIVSAYENYGELLWSNSQDRNEFVFDFTSLDEYCQLMQIIGLCFLLHRRDLLPRIGDLQDGKSAIGLVGEGNGGADWIFEELMSFGVGPENRYESSRICCSKPYEYLADALSSASNEDAIKDLDLFLKHWYKDLAGTGWHDSHKPDDNGNVGGYYGYWSFEAGAAVILLGIEDDTSLHKYLYYPKDLVAWARKHASLSTNDLSAPDKLRLRCEGGEPCPKGGHWETPAKVDSRRSFQAGEIMPSIDSDYGQTIWQWVGP